MQPTCAEPLPASLQARSQRLLTRWPGKQPIRQRSQIKPGSTGHNGQLSSACNALSAARACLLYSPAVNGSSGSATSIKWCRTHARSSRVGFAVPRFHPSIDSHRIAADNFAVEFLRQRQRKRRLPAPCRTEDDDCQRFLSLLALSCCEAAVRRARRAQGRHQPVGKIQAGFVCQSHHPKIPPAIITNPIA